MEYHIYQPAWDSTVVQEFGKNTLQSMSTFGFHVSHGSAFLFQKRSYCKYDPTTQNEGLNNHYELTTSRLQHGVVSTASTFKSTDFHGKLEIKTS